MTEPSCQVFSDGTVKCREFSCIGVGGDCEASFIAVEWGLPTIDSMVPLVWEPSPHNPNIRVLKSPKSPA